MNAKVPFAAACAAMVLFLTPAVPRAERPPVLKLLPTNEQPVHDTDPWMPDSHENDVTLRDPDRTSVEAESPSAVRPRTFVFRSLLTILKLFHFGGIVR